MGENKKSPSGEGLRLLKKRKELYEKKMKAILSDERRCERRVEAMLQVKHNLGLMELIADINNVHSERLWEMAKVIAEYINEKYEGTETDEEIVELIVERVWEDKEHNCELWCNGISNEVSQLRGEVQGCSDLMYTCDVAAHFCREKEEG